MILNMNDALEACKKLKEIDKDIGKQYEEKLKKIPVGKLQPPTTEWKPQIGDWIYASKNNDDWRENQFIPLFKLEDFDSTKEWLRPTKDKSSGVHIKNCRKATQEEIISVQKPVFNQEKIEERIQELNKEELLKEAKKRFPVGTKVKNSLGTTFTVRNGCYVYKNTNDIIDKSETDGNYLYYQGKWAEIIEMPKNNCVIYVGEDLQQKKFEINQENGEKLKNIWNNSLYKIGIDPTRLLKVETHQSINKTGKRFSPIKVELIKVKKLKK